MQVAHSLDEVVRVLIELAARVSKLDGQAPVITAERTVVDDLDEIRRQLAALSQPVATVSPEIEARVAALEAAPDPTSDLARRVAELEARPPVMAVEAAPVDLQPLWARICEVENRPLPVGVTEAERELMNQTAQSVAMLAAGLTELNRRVSDIELAIGEIAAAAMRRGAAA